MRKASLTSLSLAKKIANFAEDVKAEDIIILDMRNIVNFCDFFVICSGTADRHVQAIASGIEEGLDDLGVSNKTSEGMRSSNWVVFDTGDVIAHIFYKPLREFYNLEYLWRDAKVVKGKA